MKSLAPAILPIVLIVGLVAILVASSDLGKKNDASNSPILPDIVTQPAQPQEPIMQQNRQAPIQPTPPLAQNNTAGAYPVSQYPFVNRAYSWKLHKGRGAKYTFRFNPDGSVTQNFNSTSMRWRPNHSYSLILSNKTGWFADVVFDQNYNELTGRPQGEKSVYLGKAIR